MQYSQSSLSQNSDNSYVRACNSRHTMINKQNLNPTLPKRQLKKTMIDSNNGVEKTTFVNPGKKEIKPGIGKRLIQQ